MICSFIEKDYSVEYKKLNKNKGVSKMSFIDWRKIDGCKNE